MIFVIHVCISVLIIQRFQKVNQIRPKEDPAYRLRLSRLLVAQLEPQVASVRPTQIPPQSSPNPFISPHQSPLWAHHYQSPSPPIPEPNKHDCFMILILPSEASPGSAQVQGGRCSKRSSTDHQVGHLLHCTDCLVIMIIMIFKTIKTFIIYHHWTNCLIDAYNNDRGINWIYLLSFIMTILTLLHRCHLLLVTQWRSFSVESITVISSSPWILMICQRPWCYIKVDGMDW